MPQLAKKEDILVCELNIDYLDQAAALEQLCYDTPWSKELIAKEFSKDISLRPAFFQGDNLIAQSFNYIVADELHILNIAVHPDWQNQGIGQELLCYIMSTATFKGADFATLEVRESNVRARNLYKKLGFKQVNKRPGYYKSNGEDALIFEQTISAKLLQTKGYFRHIPNSQLKAVI